MDWHIMIIITIKTVSVIWYARADYGQYRSSVSASDNVRGNITLPRDFSSRSLREMEFGL